MPVLKLSADGGARPNPGAAAIGVVVFGEHENVICEVSHYLGEATSNVAEWTALVVGLEVATQIGAGELHIRMDSQLVVRQLKGEYEVRDAKLAPLARRAKELLRRIAKWKVEHVPRKQNPRADALVNLARDRRAKGQ